MKRFNFVMVILITICVGLFLISCYGSGFPPAYTNAGASDLSPAGSEFINTLLFRFDTSISGHTLTIPGASDIISSIPSATAGNVLLFAISADGANPVTIEGGPNVNVKTSAANVEGNSTLTIYLVVDNASSGSQQVTIY